MFSRPESRRRAPASGGLPRNPLSKRYLRYWRRRWARDGQRGATMLETVLLLAAVVLPSYAIIQLGLRALFGHYQLVTTLNGLPLP
ncbi:MAG: hypothetical protein AAFX76_11955 [Planctomycetota bacterium]